MAISIRDFETFLLSAQGVLLFHGSILLIALTAAFLFLVKKPRREWERGLFLALAVIFLQGIGLAIDSLGPAWNNPSLSSLLANVDRALEMLYRHRGGLVLPVPAAAQNRGRADHNLGDSRPARGRRQLGLLSIYIPPPGRLTATCSPSSGISRG